MDNDLKRALGPEFKGLDTNWQIVKEQIEWAQRAMACGSSLRQ